MKPVLAAGLLALAFALQGCNQNQETQTAEAPPAQGETTAPAGEGAVYTTQGEVTAVGPDNVTIRHDPIAELNWPSMNMMFKAPDAAMIGGLTPGAQVTFSFHQEGAAYVLSEIERR